MSDIGELTTDLALNLCCNCFSLASKTGGYILGTTTLILGTIRSILIVTWGLSTLSTGPIPTYKMIESTNLKILHLFLKQPHLINFVFS